MIAFFNGPPGVGKTYHATAYALHCLDVGERVAVSWRLLPPDGVRVIDLRRHDDDGTERTPDMTIAEANRVLGPVIFRFDVLQEAFGLRWCQVFRDEAQNELGARDWEKLSLKVRIWMSEHRHYGTNLFLYTQHYKFVDVYPRRLAVGNVSSIYRLLNLTLETPCPMADPETGELGPRDLLATRLIRRPWHSLDIRVPIPGFWKLLLDLSKRVTSHYQTHAPHENDLRAPEKKVSRSAPPSAPTSREQKLPI